MVKVTAGQMNNKTVSHFALSKNFSLGTFILVFGVYLLSMPQTVVLEDDGLFTLTAYYNGIAHPPGYPLYTLLSHVATWIPFGSIAFRIHAFTAMLGAASCVCLFHIVRKLGIESSIAFIASLSFGYSLSFWSQAIISEAYTLNVLIILALFYVSLMYREASEEKNRQRLLNFFVIIYGLGLSNHWPLLAVSTPALGCLLWPHKKVIFRQILKSIPYLSVGIMFYIWMVVRSRMDPFVSFYGPINNLDELWFYISREGYSTIDFNLSADWSDKAHFLMFSLVETVKQFGPLGIIPMLTGIIYQWTHWNKTLAFSLLLLYLGNTFMLIFLLGFDYDYHHQNIFRVYPLMAYAACVIWIALGLKVICLKVLKLNDNKIGKSFLMAAIGLLFVGNTLVANTVENYRKNDVWVDEYSNVIFANIEQDSILFTFGDMDVWTLGYHHLILNQRPDIQLYSLKGIVYSNRLFHQNETPLEEAEHIIRNFIMSTSRPIYYSSSFISGFSETDYGLFKQINREGRPDYRKAIIIPAVKEYIETLLGRGEPVNRWEKMHYRLILSEYCKLSLNILEYSNSDTQNEELQRWVDRVCDTFHGNLLQAEQLLNKGNKTVDDINSVLARAEKLSGQAVLKSEIAMYYFLRGEVLSRAGNTVMSKKMYLKSYNHWKHPENPSKGMISAN